MVVKQGPIEGLHKKGLLDSVYEEYGKALILQQVANGKPLVRGAGPLDAPIVVVGEAPGEDEEDQGEPFVGRSGQLLQRLFAQAGLPWQICYRMNVLPWRPPGNRTPYNFEVVESYGRVAKEITVVSPKVVIAAGAVAWRCITRQERGAFADNRGKWLLDHDFPYELMAVYHPSAILRARGAEQKQMKDETLAALRSALVTGNG